jgi:hypothetical protein
LSGEGKGKIPAAGFSKRVFSGFFGQNDAGRRLTVIFLVQKCNQAIANQNLMN